MLRAAEGASRRGVDTVVGVLTSHLQVSPDLESFGDSSPELSLDSILNRRPRLVVVENLAHANPRGSRHEKRYQDVQELLDHGIDVFTSLDIYQIESLSDLVLQVTGLVMSEGVPDVVFERASEVVLVDLSPKELLQRYTDGVTRPFDDRFRNEGVLTALREVSLRHASNRAEEDVRRFRRANSIEQVWATADRLLVCVGPSPLSQPLVKATKRLADSVKAPWIALHVAHRDISASQRESVQRNLALARKLGAQVREVTAPFTSETLVQFASEENVTKIVLGKPAHRTWTRWNRGSLVDQLLSHSSGLDVIVVGADSHQDDGMRKPASAAPHPRRNFVWATLIVSLATLVGRGLPAEFDRTNIVMLYLATVVCISYFFGKGPALLASSLAVLYFNFLFIPPTLTFDVSHPQYILTFLGLFFVGWLVSDLTERSKKAAEAALRREKQAVTLFALQRDLLKAEGATEVRTVGARYLHTLFGQSIVLLRDGEQLQSHELPEPESRVADWALRNNQSAGKGSQTFPESRNSWNPVSGSSQAYAVAGLAAPPADQETSELFQAVLGEIGTALERVELAESAAESELLRATEKLQKALLNSVSHDLRVPLVSINGALSGLLNEELKLTPKARREITENALSEAERLTLLVTNLLHMSKMEAGQIHLNAIPCDPWDLVSTTVSAFRRRVGAASILLQGADEMPLVNVDYVLLQQVLFNLLENATRYGEGAITVSLESVDEAVVFSVEDQGQPIPPEEIDRVFERFYRSHDLADGGSGLGLSISKGLVEAHGGKIWIEGGKKFRFSLPVSQI